MSTPTKQSVSSLFKSDDAADLGISPKGSDIMIANLNATTLPLCVGTPIRDIETDDITVIMFAIDASPSMEPVRELLIETFNEVMIDGLKGASKRTANSIIVGGLAFSTTIRALWGGGFQKLELLPALTKREYDPNRGSGTNLYQAMLDAVTAASAYATQVFRDTGTPPKVIVVALTDGADNVAQASAADVKTVTDGLSREIWKLPCAVFETWEKVNGRQIAKESGFDVFEFKTGQSESQADVKRRFRHMIGTLSSQVISASQAQVGAPSKSFWTV